MPYSGILESILEALASRSVCKDSGRYTDVISSALKTVSPRPAIAPPELSNSLQGNLSEFCIWHIGHKNWLIFLEENSYGPNIVDPWSNHSKSGIDIIAYDINNSKTLVLEVKSSCGDGVSQIASEKNSLKEDYNHLFKGAPDNKLITSMSSLIFFFRHSNRKALADAIRDNLGDGTGPNELKNIEVMGVLVCSTKEASKKRNEKFEELKKYLLDSGWKPDQFQFRTLEFEDFADTIQEIIKKSYAN